MFSCLLQPQGLWNHQRSNIKHKHYDTEVTLTHPLVEVSDQRQRWSPDNEVTLQPRRREGPATRRV